MFRVRKAWSLDKFFAFRNFFVARALLKVKVCECPRMGGRGDATRATIMNAEDKKHTVPQPQPYAEEILCANWNPLVLLLSEPLACAQKTVSDSSEVEDFMARLYLSQQA